MSGFIRIFASFSCREIKSGSDLSAGSLTITSAQVTNVMEEKRKLCSTQRRSLALRLMTSEMISQQTSPVVLLSNANAIIGSFIPCTFASKKEFP